MMIEQRVWPEHSVTFARVRAPYGELGNFAPMPLEVRGWGSVPTSEALYQALRFPDEPTLQGCILLAPSPYRAKALRADGTERSDWHEVKFRVMWLVLQAKLAQHRAVLWPLLQSTAGRCLVEYSVRDSTWGARWRSGRLAGGNALGRMWMALRDDKAIDYPPPADLRLMDRPLCPEDLGL